MTVTGMDEITAVEFVDVNLIEPEAVKSSPEKSLTDIITFWEGTSERMPGLSREE